MTFQFHTVPHDKKHAEQNALNIERALLDGGTCSLPPGITYTSRRVRLGPQHSHGTLAGAGMGASVLQQIGQPWPEYGGIAVLGEGFDDPGPSDVDVAEGAVTLPGRDGWPFGLGQWIYPTSGPMLSDPLTGEFRRVLAHVGDGRILLDRPLRRAYAKVRLATGAPVVGVTIRDLTIAQPEHAGAYKLIARWAVGLTCERVRFGQPGEPAAGWGPGTCGHFSLIDCESPDCPLGLNTTHDIVIRGGRYQSIVGEENCLDADVSDLLIAPGGSLQPGLKWYYGSERLRARNVRIEGGGALATEGGSHSPLAVWGRQCRLEGVTVWASLSTPGLSGLGLGGDDLVVSGCTFDLETWVTNGTGVLLADSAAPKWVLIEGTAGRLRDCGGPMWRSNEDWDDGQAVDDVAGRAARAAPDPVGLPGHVRGWMER